MASIAHQQRFIVTFEGIATREEAEHWRGVVLSAPRLEDESVIWIDQLYDAEVFDANGVRRGVVVGVEANPASDLLGARQRRARAAHLRHHRRGERADRCRRPRRTLRMTLRVDVLTLFPDAVDPVRRDVGARARASSATCGSLHVHDFRDATDDVHRTVDDTPFGGGAGMVLARRADPAHPR